MEQRVSLLTLGVVDLARARRFYEALGWVGQEVEETGGERQSPSASDRRADGDGPPPLPPSGALGPRIAVATEAWHRTGRPFVAHVAPP